MTGHVLPDQIPYVNPVNGYPVVDPETIRTSATGLQGVAGNLRSAGEDTVKAWSGITACYHAPDEGVVWEAMVPVGPATDGLASRVEKVVPAVSGFADEITPIITTLKSLKSQAESLVGDINGFKPYTRHDWRSVWNAGLWAKGREVSDLVGAIVGIKIQAWDQDPDLVGRNNDLIKKINNQVALYEQAERRCANQINAIYGGTQWKEWGTTTNTAAAYGWDETALDASDQAWGASVDVAESGSTKAILFIPNLISGVSDGADGMIGGLFGFVGGLFGVSVEKGSVLDDESGVQLGDVKLVWSWQTSAQTGENLVDTAAGLVMTSTGLGVVAPIPEYDFTTGQWSYPIAGQITKDLGKSLLDWDEWGKDPGTATGEVAFTVASFLIPGVGEAGKAGDAGKFAEVSSDAAKVGDAAEAAGKVGDAAEDAAKVSDAAKLAEAEKVSEAGDAVEAGDAAETVDKFTIPEVTKPVPDSDPLVHPEPEPEPVHTEPEPEPGVVHPEPEPVHTQPEPAPVHPEPAPVPDPVLHPTPEPEPVVTPESHDGEPNSVQPTAAHDQDASTPGETSPADQPPHPVPRPISAEQNALDHGIDPHQVDPRGITQIQIDSTPEHFQGFNDTSIARDSAQDGNEALKDIRNQILQDHEEITLTETDLARSNATDMIRKLQKEYADDDDLSDALDLLNKVNREQHATQVSLSHLSEALGSTGGDDVIHTWSGDTLYGGPGIGRDSFDKTALMFNRSELWLLEEKGGSATLSEMGRLLPDGSRAAQGSTLYMMDVAKHDQKFLAYMADPAHADVAQGLKDGTMSVRYILTTSPGDGTTMMEDLVLNPDYVDWSWLPVGGK